MIKVKNDEERAELICKFFGIYRRLQKKISLKMQSHFDIYGENYIEVWIQKDHKKNKTICRAKEEEETACYKRAIEDLRRFEKTLDRIETLK